MNKHRDPCIYALTTDAGDHFYVGRTKINAQNRLWEHNYRANSGHTAPVYARMREIGVGNVRVEILHSLAEGDDDKAIEAAWIKNLLDIGYQLVNAYGRDGTPDSWSVEQKERGVPSRRGVPTWIKGKTGDAAGWTEERKRAQSERIKVANNNK